MSDPPPKKIGSLRDRIAAFENKGGAPAPAPAPVPRPKPGGLSQWKARATSPPAVFDDDGEKQERKIASGMSAADAKASIGAGGSLKERMAALQGRSAFGMPAAPSIPPKPAGEKPKWKPPPQPVASPPPTEEGEEPAAAPEPRVTSPPPQDESRPAEDHGAEEKPEEKEETGEPDPEEEERQRRAALAARMARLGGARVGMGPPIFAKKPDIKKPEVAKEEEHKEAPGAETVVSPPAEEPRSPPVAAAETPASEKTTEPSAGYFEEKNASSTSLLSADSTSTNTPKSPAMPAPAMPRRAAPPRRKAPKSPSPAPPTPSLDAAVVAESPAPDAPPSPEESEQSKELQEAVRKSKEDEASLGLPPAVLEHREVAPPHAEPTEPSTDTKTAPEPSTQHEEDVREHPTEHEDQQEHVEPQAAGPAPEAVPETSVVLEPKAAEPAHEEAPDSEVPATKAEEKSEETPINEAPVTEEPPALAPEPAPADEEEEDEQARRKRIAERLRQQGGFNPFGAPPPPPVRRPSEASSVQEVEVPVRKPSLDSPRSPPLSPPIPPRPASLRKDSAGSAIVSPPPPERRTSLRQGSMDSVTGSLRSPPLPPASSRPDVPARKSSVASTKSKEAEDVAEEQIQDDEQEIRVRESVNAPSGAIQEEPEVSDDDYEDTRSGDPETVRVGEDESGHPIAPEAVRHVDPAASAWYDEPEEDNRAHDSHVHTSEQPPSQTGGFEEPSAESISPISPPPTEQPPPPPKRTSHPPPPKRTSLPPPPREVPPPPPPPVLEQEPEYDEPEGSYLEVDDEPESVYSPSPISPPTRQAPPPVVQPEEHSPEPEQPPPPPPPRRQSSDVHPARRSIPPPPPPHEPELEHEPALAEEEQHALQPPSGSHPARRSVPPPPPPVNTGNHEDDTHDDASDYGPASPRSEAYSEDGQALQIPSALNSQVPSPVSPSRIPPAIVIPDQKESEVFDEADVDPIDPSFYSPSKPTFSPSGPSPPALSLIPPSIERATKPTEEPTEEDHAAEPESEVQAETEKTPEPAVEKAPEPEDKPEEDEEQTRRRTIAERMAKLGGIRFGPPPPIARRPPPPPAEEAASPEVEEHEQPPKAEEPEAAREEPEEDEFARKQRIAAKIAGMGGMRLGMIPTPMAPPPPPVRSPSQPSAPAPEAEEQEEEEAPPPPPPRTARRQESHDAHDEEAPPPPPPRRPSHHEEPREVELDTQSADDGEHVEAEESEAEVVVHPEEEEAPPPIPSRSFRRESAPSPETSRPPVPAGRPPVPAGRPPVPLVAPPPPVSVAPPTPRDDFVMVEAPEEASPVPPPRSASLRRPPPRSAPPPPPPPPPVAEEPGTPTSQWGSSVDFGGEADLSLSAQWSEDSTQYPPAPPARAQSISQHSQQSVVPQHLSPDELMAQWGRIGVQIHEVATTLFEKSKKSLVGDGTYVGFINAVLHEVPTAAKPLPPYDTFGYVIYEQNGPSVQRRASDIMPGDIVMLHEAKLKGHKGIQMYHQNVGVGQPLVAIIGDYEVKKSKVRVFQANQHVGQESVESVSYRLEDLKTGLVKIFRVLEA